MHVFHTCGVPPSMGKMSLPMMGCTKNRMNALMNRVSEKSGNAKDHLHVVKIDRNEPEA